MKSTEVRIPSGSTTLEGELLVPDEPHGLIIFAHGSGSSRLSPRNRQVADYLRATDEFGTLLFDLLTEGEDVDYQRRFDIPLLADRLSRATDWLRSRDDIGHLPVGYFGASTGAAAALVAASLRDDIAAIVSRGGRPDLAWEALPLVEAPTLLIVGGADVEVLGLNERAAARIGGAIELMTIPGATHLFEEPGALEEVSRLARGWFARYVV